MIRNRSAIRAPVFFISNNLCIFAGQFIYMQRTMKIYSTLIVLIMLALSSCKENPTFTIRAEMDGLADKPILVVYDDPTSRLDTIFPKEGKFDYAFTPDTITLFRLVMPETGEVIPVFADKGQEMTLAGTFQAPDITGDGMNGEYGALLKEVQALKDSASIAQAIEKFIQTHPSSFASAYLINQYFIQVPSPDTEKIDRLIAPLAGNIKDSRILSVILKTLPSQENNTRQNKEYVNYFSCKDREGKYISWSGEKGSYTLLNFWASWDEESLVRRDSLAKLVEKFPEKKFKVLNISLDYEKDKWLGKCKKDTKQWIETCDFKGWNNTIVKQNQIHTLPANILINNSRKIIDVQLYNQALYNKVNEELKE